jgi:transposase
MTEMLTVETIRKIRLATRDGKKSIRQTAKDFNVSRNTVRKILRSDQTRFEYHRESVHRPKLGPFVDTLTTLLKDDQPLPLKQRRTAQGLYEALQAEGYRGAYDSVRRFVKSWRAEHQGTPVDAYIPLVFEPGEAFQFDWSHEKIVIAGAMTDVKVAHIRLSHSRLFLTVAYLRESQEMVFDAHRRAFEFFGGVARRGIYDNMKTAVCRILRGKERDFNRRFEEMASHYLFEPVACTPAAGWEKGQVENQVRTVRRRLFTPTRKAKSLDELNEALRTECLLWARKQRHPVLKDQTVWAVFESERASLLTLPRAFDGYAERTVRVTSTSLVSFDRNRYSVDCKAAGRTAELRSYANKIVVLHDGEIVAQHSRCFQRDQMIFDPWHYLPVLQKKPGALRNGAPFKDWDLPRSIHRTWQRLKHYPDWDRQLVDILACVPGYGLDAVADACNEALGNGSVSRDVIINLLARQQQEPDPEIVTIPAHLELSEPPVADCARYDRFRKEVTHVA